MVTFPPKNNLAFKCIHFSMFHIWPRTAVKSLGVVNEAKINVFPLFTCSLHYPSYAICCHLLLPFLKSVCSTGICLFLQFCFMWKKCVQLFNMLCILSLLSFLLYSLYVLYILLGFRLVIYLLRNICQHRIYFCISIFLLYLALTYLISGLLIVTLHFQGSEFLRITKIFMQSFSLHKHFGHSINLFANGVQHNIFIISYSTPLLAFFEVILEYSHLTYGFSDFFFKNISFFLFSFYLFLAFSREVCLFIFVTWC